MATTSDEVDEASVPERPNIRSQLKEVRGLPTRREHQVHTGTSRGRGISYGQALRTGGDLGVPYT